jgi:DNA adenine methylase
MYHVVESAGHARSGQPHAPACALHRRQEAAGQRLVARINAVPHTIYAEPFVGMGGIFFRRDQRPKCEVINDWSEDVATFFRILQRHYVPFMDMLRWQVTSRAGFERLRRQDPSTLTDLERAARFLYLQKLAFGGKVSSRVFGMSTTGSARFDVAKVGPCSKQRMSGCRAW